jgi:hypothetical protein
MPCIASGRAGYAVVLRSPGVLVLWLAQVQSVLGDRLYALAMMWLVWQVTHSAFLMGLAAVLESVPYVLLGAWGGGWLPGSRRCAGWRWWTRPARCWWRRSR